LLLNSLPIKNTQTDKKLFKQKRVGRCTTRYRAMVIYPVAAGVEDATRCYI